MKKILLILSSLILFLNQVQAEEWQILENNKHFNDDIAIEFRYKFYKEEKKGDYFPINGNISNKYLYHDENDYIYSKFSDWLMECPSVNTNITEEKLFYPYQKIKDTNYIHIQNFTDDIGFEQIEIYSNDKKINYEFMKCDNCYDNYDYVERYGRIFLKLDKSYDTSTLKFIIKAKEGYNNIDYSLYVTEDIDKYFYTLNARLSSNNTTFIPDVNWVQDSSYTDIIYSDEEIESNIFNKILPTVNMCRYKEKLIFYYNYERKYYDNNYYVNVDGYIKDINDYKVYYRYLSQDNGSNKMLNNSSLQTNKTLTTNQNVDREISTKNEEKKDNNRLKEDIKKDKPLVNTMKIKKDVSIFKYFILIVIILTIIYIFYRNKKYIEKSR